MIAYAPHFVVARGPGHATLLAMPLINTATPGPLSLLVVDASMNRDGWEHRMTRKLCTTLTGTGVSLVGASPYLPMDVAEFDEVFRKHAKDGWNGLLLVSHGAPPREPGGAAVLRIGELRTHWFLANAVTMNLDDKAVFLAICSGACEDAIWVLLREQLALTLTGSSTSLTGQEVINFFPAFLSDVDRASKMQGEITPEALRDAAERHATLANNKIKVLSAVDFVKE